MRSAIAMLACLALPVFAGSQQEAPRRHAPEAIIKFAKQTEHYLAEQGAYAAIIARVGRASEDLPEGISFTHTAIALYSDVTLDDGTVEQGYAIHNLYQLADKPGTSVLKTDYPVDFFWGATELKAGIIIPDWEVQQKIVALYAQDKAKLLHEPAYSVIASPFTEGKQNCTEYTLDVLNAAIYDTTDSHRLKNNTQAWFKAQPVKVNKMKLRLGSWVSSGVSLSDHPGAIQTATFTTIANYLENNQLVAHQTVLYASH